MAHPMAGKHISDDMITNIPKLVSNYFLLTPNPNESTQIVSFGTSGHRGSASKKSFNQDHILAITQALCEYRQSQGYNGPIYIGIDSHALSIPAQMSAISVCVANGIDVCISKEFTPTPLVSFAVLEHNKSSSLTADGIVITPSHNPPSDGGFKYNPPNGGPADTDVTTTIQNRANEILKNGLKDVKFLPYEEAVNSKYIKEYDFITPYVKALKDIVDIDAIVSSNLKLAVDPLGGSALGVYKKIKEYYDLNLDIVNTKIDPTFSFMTLDHDGKIRMDCSSSYAMASLVHLKDRYDLAFGNDTDADRHGIVTPVGGLMNPNHFLSVAIWYLFKYRSSWSSNLKVGKTLVSSSMIDKVANMLGKEVYEVPVGFKWFVDGLYEGWLGFGGEESAGASFLRFDGSVWSTDKDGIIMTLLSAEIKAVTGKDPAQIYSEFEEEFGKAYYARVDAPASLEQKNRLKNLSPADITADKLAEDKITYIYTNASGNDAPIGGLKLVTDNGWVAIRPSGTEDIYKIYAESFISQEHLTAIQQSAKEIVDRLLE